MAQSPFLFVLDLAGTPLDEFPNGVKALNGTMTVVDKDGQRMLRASSPSEFLITLSQALPADFTVEVDLIPKSCCNPDDFMLEGTPTMNRGVASVQLTWHPARLRALGGGGEMYQSDMPADLAASTPGNLTQLVATFSGTTIKLYTNGRRMYTLDKQFVRGRVLRVGLGGQDEGAQAVFLAGLRVAPGISSGSAATQHSSLGAGGSGGQLQRVGGGPATAAPTTASSSAAMTAASTTSAAFVGPPVGAGPAPPAVQQPAGTPGSMRLDKTSFGMVLLEGGSTAAGVVETRRPDGTIDKQPGTAGIEPLVFDVSYGSPVDDWLKDLVSGRPTLKDGALFGGVVPAQQELGFSNASLVSVAIPTLDATSQAPAFLRATVVPQQVGQTVLSSGPGPALTSWPVGSFRLTVGNLETRRTTRIESFSIGSVPGTSQTSPVPPGGQPQISNLLVTFVEDPGRPATNWLAWYDDFVLRGNNDDKHELELTLELGIPLTRLGQAALTLKGYGVGIVALRTLPQVPGSTVRRLQAELYVERMEVYP